MKFTTFAGNLKLELPGKPELEAEEEMKEEQVRSSKDLVRWAPGIMREVVTQLQ